MTRDDMLEIVIIGGGLCGLALAKRLAQRGIDLALYEARERFGGRVLSRRCPVSAIDFDLGPSWFWPDSEPLIAASVVELGLRAFPQADGGSVLVLTEPDKGPSKREGETVHAGAMRIEGGMQALIDALIDRLPKDRLHLSHVLAAVEDRGDHVELGFLAGEKSVSVTARRVVLAMPPRLVEEHVSFRPNLAENLLETMLATPTAMASTAKAVMTYGAMERFRETCGAGNAFVHHEQAVLSEIFDASAPDGGKAALGGFLALPPELRRSFHAGLPMLIGSQFAQVFGPGFELGELHVQDWASEFFTCASQDRRRPTSGAKPQAEPLLLRASHWNGKLIFAGSETAENGAGHLEGALDAAERAERLILSASHQTGTPRQAYLH